MKMAYAVIQNLNINFYNNHIIFYKHFKFYTMKTILQFFMIFLLSISIYAQEKLVNISMQPAYASQVYFKLSTETATSFAANSWDIAFLRTSAFNFGMRVNDGIGISVFEASNNPADWNSIDVANETSWTALYNSDTSWSGGAFENGSATYGWGEYNIANHHITGKVIFVLKYANGIYRKFFCEDYFGGYTFKYATWNAATSSWDADQNVTISNSSNPTNKYNYYSLQNNSAVIAEPAIADWDFVFTKFATDYYGDGSLYYPVTGVLHSESVTVAQNDETTGMPVNPSLTYSQEINTIGYDWKSLNASYTYDINSNRAFYVKYADNTIYRLYFTSFSGSSTGNISFAFENVTNSLGIEDVNNGVTFGVYPNPTSDKKINLIYDVNKLSSNINEVAIYSLTGSEVLKTSLSKSVGFYNKSLDLSNLQSGVYVLKFTSGNHTTSKKIILK